MHCTHVLVALAALAAAPAAQTVYGIQGTSATVIEMSGPSAGPCSYPDGPLASSFNTMQPPVCGGVAVPGLYETGLNLVLGDVAVDRHKDIVYVTNGFTIAGYDADTGNMLELFDTAALGLAPPLTGLGFDATKSRLWITNPGSYAAYTTNGTCAPVPAMPATPAPVGYGVLGDIDVDPQTGELWVCTFNGVVLSFNAGTVAPIHSFSVLGAGAACGGLTPFLKGLCVDASSNATVLMLTDGPNVVRIKVTGVATYGAAPISLMFPSECWPVPGAGDSQGLAFAAHDVTYGPGALTLRVRGESTLPGNITLQGSGGPAGTAWIMRDFFAACPPGMVKGQPLLLPLGPGWGLIGPLPWTGGAPALSLPIALPAPGALPFDVTIHMQVLRKAGATWASSNAVAFTTSRL